MGKGYHIYIKDEKLCEIFNVLNMQRGQLSQVITELAWNGMDKTIGKHLKIQQDLLKSLKKADKTMKQTKTLRKTQKEEMYQQFAHRLKTNPFKLTHKENLIWIKNFAERLGVGPEAILIEFEKRHKEKNHE